MIQQRVFQIMSVVLSSGLTMMGYLIWLSPYNVPVTVTRRLLDASLAGLVFGLIMGLIILPLALFPAGAKGNRARLLRTLIALTAGTLLAGGAWFVVQVMQVQMLNGDTFTEAIVYLFVFFGYFDNLPMLVIGGAATMIAFWLYSLKTLPLWSRATLSAVILFGGLAGADSLNPLYDGVMNWCCGLVDFQPGGIIAPLVFVLLLTIGLYLPSVWHRTGEQPG